MVYRNIRCESCVLRGFWINTAHLPHTQTHTNTRPPLPYPRWLFLIVSISFLSIVSSVLIAAFLTEAVERVSKIGWGDRRVELSPCSVRLTRYPRYNIAACQSYEYVSVCVCACLCVWVCVWWGDGQTLDRASTAYEEQLFLFCAIRRAPFLLRVKCYLTKHYYFLCVRINCLRIEDG